MTKTLEIDDDETYDRIEAYAAANSVDIPKYLKRLYLSPNVNKVFVDMDQKSYDLIIGKLPWAATSIEDFAQAAISEKMEHLLLLAFNPTALAQPDPVTNENQTLEDNGITFEQITVKIPKAIMNLLRYAQPVTGDTPEQDIEYGILDNVRARIESGGFLPTPKGLADKFNLNPIFKEILEDTIEE